MGLAESLAEVGGRYDSFMEAVKAATPDIGKDFLGWAEGNINPHLPEGYRLKSCQVKDAVGVDACGERVLVFEVGVRILDLVDGVPTDTAGLSRFMEDSRGKRRIAYETIVKKGRGYRPACPKGMEIRLDVKPL